MTYLLLGQETREGVLRWVEFQSLWMGIRLLVYHLIAPDDPLANRQLAEQPKPLPQDMKQRILKLTMTLSKYQTYIHPRGDYCYPYDCFDASDILSLVAQHNLTFPSVDLDGNSTCRISVKAVIGDTTLSSASWIAGSNLTPMELYDSCVVVFNMRSSFSSLLAIPAVRVLSGRPFRQAADPEKVTTAAFAPKGASNDGYDIWWRYWIPLDSGQWLFLSTPDDSLDLRRSQTGNVMSNEEVMAQLEGGMFNIGFSRIEDLKAALEASRQSFRHLQAIFPSMKAN